MGKGKDKNKDKYKDKYKNKPSTSNNTMPVNIEIDYDKLAESIAKAIKFCSKNSEEVDEVSVEQSKEEKTSFWKSIYCIIFNKNKKKTNGRMTSDFLGGLIAALFNLIFVSGIFFFIIGIAAIVLSIIHLEWSQDIIAENIFFIVLVFLSTITVAVYSIIFRGLANEVAAEKDRNYIVALFSGVFSFAAFVVALIALLKGMA